MTAIVALSHKGKVYVGGDSAGVGGGYALTVRADAKVFRTGPFVMGFTSSFRMGQLLRYGLAAPDHDPRVEDAKYLATGFIDAVRRCLKDGGFAAKDKDREEAGTFVVAYRGRVYVVHDDYQVGEPADGFAAVGCGADVALGALFANTKAKPKDRVLTALAAAERFSAGVRAPFVVEVL